MSVRHWPGQELGCVQANHDAGGVHGRTPLGQQRAADHHHERDRDRPRRGLRQQRARPTPGSATDDRDQHRGDGQDPAGQQTGQGARRGEPRPPHAEHQKRAERRSGDGERQADDGGKTEVPAGQAEQVRDDDGQHRTDAEHPDPLGPASGSASAEQVLRQHTGHRDRQPRRRGQERGERPGRHQRRKQRPGLAADHPLGQHQRGGVGIAGQQQVRDVTPPDRAVHRRQQVERGQQDDHDQRCPARVPSVGIGVEPHEHVRKAHRAQTDREDERQAGVQRMRDARAEGPQPGPVVLLGQRGDDRDDDPPRRASPDCPRRCDAVPLSARPVRRPGGRRPARSRSGSRGRRRGPCGARGPRRRLSHAPVGSRTGCRRGGPATGKRARAPGSAAP